MTGNNDINRRIRALEEIIRPSESLEARLAALSETDGKIYEYWRQETAAWHATFESPGDAYEAYLNGTQGPKLPARLANKLFGPTPEITTDMTPGEIADVWNEFKGRRR